MALFTMQKLCFKIFYVVKFLNLFFHCIQILSHSLKSFPSIQAKEEFTHICLQDCTVFFTFRLLIYLKFILLYGGKYLILSFSPTWLSSYPSTIYFKSPLLSQCIEIPPLSYSKFYSIFIQAYLWIFYSIPLVCLFISQFHIVLIIEALLCVLMYGRAAPPPQLSFFSVFLEILECLFFHMNFRTNPSNSIKYVGIFIEMALNLKINLGRTDIFRMSVSIKNKGCLSICQSLRGCLL